MANGSVGEPWRFCEFGLIVTGEGERDFIPSLFRSLQDTGHCRFQVITQIGQRSPITSVKRKLEMVGTGKTIPNRDQDDIGLPARAFLSRESTFVILIDDLERKRAADIESVFQRYRLALDTMLLSKKSRAAVHFFVNMLEAYYFADATAINTVLQTELEDHEDDVETIHHPKGELKRLFRDFDEKEHGRQIVARLDVPHVLARPETCASLRTLFGWCSKVIGEPATDRYQLLSGKYNEVTKSQMDGFEDTASKLDS